MYKKFYKKMKEMIIQINQQKMKTIQMAKANSILVMDILLFKIRIRMMIKECKNLQKGVCQ